MLHTNAEPLRNPERLKLLIRQIPWPVRDRSFPVADLSLSWKVAYGFQPSPIDVPISIGQGRLMCCQRTSYRLMYQTA